MRLASKADISKIPVGTMLVLSGCSFPNHKYRGIQRKVAKVSRTQIVLANPSGELSYCDLFAGTTIEQVAEDRFRIKWEEVVADNPIKCWIEYQVLP